RTEPDQGTAKGRTRFQTREWQPRRDRARMPSAPFRTRPARGAGRRYASWGGEEPPDRLGRLREQAVGQLGGGRRLAAVEHNAIFDHVLAVFAEQLRSHPKVAVLEHAESRHR